MSLDQRSHCGTTPSGENRRWGSVSATDSGSAVQKPCAQNCYISSHTNSMSSSADRWERPPLCRQYDRCMVPPTRVKGNFHSAAKVFQHQADALCGRAPTASAMSQRHVLQRHKNSNDSTFANLCAACSAYLRNVISELEGSGRLPLRRPHFVACIALLS